MLDAVSGALESVELAETPRMADFARWATAAESALGLGAGTFLKAYLDNRAAGGQTALENSPVGRFVVELARAGLWSGPATELLVTLNAMADRADGITEADKVGQTRQA